MSKAEPNRVESTRARKEEQAVHEYWTPERRAAAKPVPQPVPGRGEVKREAEGHAASPGTLPPGRPRSEREAVRPETSGATAVANPKAYPYRTCGKLFFTQSGHNFVASAAVVSRNVILTAGHCVHQGLGGDWSSNVAFFPSYPLAPGKSYAYHTLAAWTAWTNSTNLAFDYGMIWNDGNVGDDVGWLGLYWNAPTSGRTWDAVGYPVEPSPPFDGKTMDETRGNFVSSSTAGTIGLNNDNMKEGSSGGPWITDFNGLSEYVNGLQSFHISETDGVEYSPQFTADVKNLFDYINNPANR